jgi:heme-degrading monooxygenase HmoA
MFVHLAVHHPKAGMQAQLAESMARFGAPAHGQPGFRHHLLLRDDDSGVLVGMTMWDSKEAWEAAVPHQRAAVEHDPVGEWWTSPPEVFRLHEMEG